MGRRPGTADAPLLTLTRVCPTGYSRAVLNLTICALCIQVFVLMSSGGLNEKCRSFGRASVAGLKEPVRRPRSKVSRWLPVQLQVQPRDVVLARGCALGLVIFRNCCCAAALLRG